MSKLLDFLIEKNIELTLDRTNSTELELLAYDTIKELRKEIKKLREERDKLVECVKAVKSQGAMLRTMTIYNLADQTLKNIGEV